jgi:hypothetical protein
MFKKLQKRWSRGRELNSRPADYEMSSFAVSRWFFVSGVLSLSPPFAPLLRSNLQRNLQRIAATFGSECATENATALTAESK